LPWTSHGFPCFAWKIPSEKEMELLPKVRERGECPLLKDEGREGKHLPRPRQRRYVLLRSVAFHACGLHTAAVAANGCLQLRRRLEPSEQPEPAARPGRVHSNRKRVPLLKDGGGCICLFPGGGGVKGATCPFPKGCSPCMQTPRSEACGGERGGHKLEGRPQSAYSFYGMQGSGGRSFLGETSNKHQGIQGRQDQRIQ